jgi:DNA repair exonuclease SbcCD ATPase subunit
MIIFKKIKYRNFISSGNYFTEIELNRTQNTLIVGKNGSGKSTVLDSLCFVLFGKAFRNINKPALINSINQKDCVVEVEFDIGNKEYRIIRGIKPNIFEIYLNGSLLNQSAAIKDYQEYLEKVILKLNYKSFTQIVILGSASFVPFMQLSASDRRAIIEDLLDIQIFTSMNSILKEKFTANKENYSDNKHEIEFANQSYSLQEKHIAELKKNNEEEIVKYQKEIETTNINIKDQLKNCEKLTERISELQKEIVEKDSIKNKINNLNQLETQIETNLRKIKKDIKFFENSDDCPTCRQPIHEDFKSNQLTSLNAKSKKCDHGLLELEKKLNSEQVRLEMINEKLKSIQELQLKIATNNTTVSEMNKYVLRLNTEIESLKSVKNNLDKETEKLEEIKSKLEQLVTKQKKLIDEKSYLEVASLLLKDTGIKTRIIKQYLPIINKLVNKYLSAMDFFVNFNLDESFKETIKSRHRDEFTYSSFSEGEKQRIDMALLLTWRSVAKLKNSTNTNLLILDEVFDSSLDTNGTEYLMNLLHMLEDVNLFVISHKGDILQDKFREVIRFEKHNNFSRIVK